MNSDASDNDIIAEDEKNEVCKEHGILICNEILVECSSHFITFAQKSIGSQKSMIFLFITINSKFNPYTNKGQ